MDLRIFYFAISIAAVSYVDTCIISYDGLLCTYIETCDGRNDNLKDWSTFIISNDNQEEQINFNGTCISPIRYQGYEIYPVFLVLKNQYYGIRNNEPIPRNSGRYIEIIYSLDISDNNFSETPVIQSMSNLVRLDMSKNYLSSAVLSNANKLYMLTEINLSHNQISDIEVNNDGYIYDKLKIIDLSHNIITELSNSIFDKFVDLEKLDLSYNNIEVLSLTTFENIKNMSELNLSNNKITDINSSLFRFSVLQVLNLSGNRIKDVKLSDFEHLRNLKTLDLSSNSIKYINDNVFSTLALLENLFLNNNQLEVLDKNAFAALKSLINIDLSKNQLKSLPIKLLRSAHILTFSVEENILEGALERGMFDLIKVTKLDLSNQFLTDVKDYAFYDLTRLNTLLLNSNNIKSLSKMSFKSLVNLRELDLSNNQITNIEFNKEDLINLHSLLLKNNNLTKINHEQLQHLSSLQLLDLSDNFISQFEPTSLQTLRNLINLAINNNSLVGTLETGTFDGLVLLPSLDVSRNMLTTIQNASFNHMNQLKELNMSHCNISELQYNTFDQTGYIEVLDISYNILESFCVNTTDLKKVRTLFLNNNFIKAISSHSLYGLSELNTLVLSYNILENMHEQSFTSLDSLSYLDISHNKKLHLPVEILKNNRHINTLILSGVQISNNFSFILEDNLIFDLRLSNISAINIFEISLSKMNHLHVLTLNNNNISQLKIGDFNGIHQLRDLDLSFNQITSIQPGVFKENIALMYLNMSHNFIANIGYGIFRGLIHLDVLDISYNNLKDLQAEMFYEAERLSQLIVDHNKINTLNTEGFIGTQLTTLSIGNNLLPCQALAKLKKQDVSFEITAISTGEHSNENVHGITCYNGNVLEEEDFSIGSKSNSGIDNNSLLNGLQHILSVLITKNTDRENLGNSYLQKMAIALENSNFENSNKLSKLVNITSDTIATNNETNKMFNENNMLLNKLIKLLNKTLIVKSSSATESEFTTAPSTHLPQLRNYSNFDHDSEIIRYINTIKKELENSIANANRNMSRIESKLNNYRTESLQPTIGHEQLVTKDESTRSVFTDACVVLILCILIGFILYKVYESRMFIRNRFSSSSRAQLPEAMEHSAL